MTEKDSEKQTYTGDWHYWNNTDGGVIGPFTNNDFTIAISYENNGDINDIAFHSSSSDKVNLNEKQLGSNSFIIAPKILDDTCE